MMYIDEQMGPKQFAHFPFLRDSMIYITDQHIELEDLIKSQVFSDARKRGFKRVDNALYDLIVDRDDPKNPTPLADEADFINEILGYAYARILVSIVNDRVLTRRYELAEAKTMSARLYSRRPGISDSSIVEFISDRLGIRANAFIEETLIEKNRMAREEYYHIHFTDFLKYTSQLRDESWKLVNFEVDKGFIKLPRDKIIRILEQVLFERLEKEIPLPVPGWMIQEVRSDILLLKGRLLEWKSQNMDEDIGSAEMDCLPPCMVFLINMVRAGENLPHAGRFALTSFLSTIGMNKDEILLVFSASPDYDRSKTEYQVSHIIGETSSTKYTPPECSTMKSNGVCFNPDGLCKSHIRHPLSYYRRKKRDKASSQPRPPNEQGATNPSPASRSSPPAAPQ